MIASLHPHAYTNCMRIFHVPTFILGIALTLIGLEVAFAPEALVLTPAHAIVFEAIGRMPLGLVLTASGGLMVWEGLRGSKNYTGLFLGTLNAMFWFTVTLLPAIFGTESVSLGPFRLGGVVNGISTVAWLTLAFLNGYYYIKLRQQNNL